MTYWYATIMGIMGFNIACGIAWTFMGCKPITRPTKILVLDFVLSVALFMWGLFI